MGYGFLEFSTQDQAAFALTTLRGKPMPDTNNKKIFKLNWASYSSKSQSSQNPNEYSIYVCELDPSVTEEILRSYFSQFYQSIVGTKIIVDPSTKISKGYGFVKFSDYNESQKALTEMNGKMINGKPMKTNQASFKKGNNNENKIKMNYNTYYPQTNDVNYNVQNEQNLLLQQQYLNNYYMANGYYPNFNQLYYQMYSGYYNQPQTGMDQQQQMPQQSTQAENQ